MAKPDDRQPHHPSEATQYPSTPMHPSLLPNQPPVSPVTHTQPPPPATLPISDSSIPSWPRRVSKACCSCRRDKIRCDGARPCAGCLKKGLAPEKCIDGCLPCRRARARCEGGMPCTRCQDTHLNCVDEATTPPLKPDAALKAAAKPGRGRTVERAKLACLACRRDNKKCDDQRPCTRCQARSEECIHVTRGPKVVKLRCKACRRENRKCEDNRPCRFCAEAGEQCADVPRKGRGHGTRVKTACTNCRRDKIQCGTERPCRGCARRGYDCIDRTCQCAEKGQGHECTICRSQKNKEGSPSVASDRDDEAEDIDEVMADPMGGLPPPPPPTSRPPHHPSHAQRGVPLPREIPLHGPPGYVHPSYAILQHNTYPDSSASTSVLGMGGGPSHPHQQAHAQHPPPVAVAQRAMYSPHPHSQHPQHQQQHQQHLHQQQHPQHHQPQQQHPGPSRPTYYPVIDPNIDDVSQRARRPPGVGRYTSNHRHQDGGGTA